MIYQKRGHWKTSFSAEGFATREAAEAAESKARGISNPPTPKAIEEPSDDWSPLEKLRGWKDRSCEKCNCDPCECEEWNSVEETSSETESSMEEIS